MAPVLPPTHLWFNVIATPEGGAAVWSWIGDNPAAERLFATFAALPRKGQPVAILRYAIELIETLYFSPPWWDVLNRSAQTAIVDRMTTQAIVNQCVRRTLGERLYMFVFVISDS